MVISRIPLYKMATLQSAKYFSDNVKLIKRTEAADLKCSLTHKLHSGSEWHKKRGHGPLKDKTTSPLSPLWQAAAQIIVLTFPAELL